MSKLVEKPNISLVTILHDNTDFYPLLQHHWDTLDYPKDKLEWIIIDDSKEDHNNQIPIHENILYLRVDPSEYLAPKACAASSKIIALIFFPISLIFFMSQVKPPK